METFVVRVWVPADVEAEGPPAGLHGVVEHVPSKRGRTFRGEADLVAFIHSCLPGAGARDAPSVRGIPGAGPLDLDPYPETGLEAAPDQALGPPAT